MRETPAVLALAGALLVGCATSAPLGPVAQPAPPSDEAGVADTPDGGEPGAAGDSAVALLIFGADTVVAEVARTASERAQGLMNRESVPDGTGMLFVFTSSAVRSFWMQNTLVALDIAFMDADFVIVDIQQMEPETTNTHDSAEPARYALEVPKGWFAAHGVSVGDVPEVVWDP